MTPHKPPLARQLKLMGRRLGELRRKGGHTQESFAEMAGWSVKYVQRLELGHSNFTVETLMVLAGFLGVEIVQLFTSPESLRVRRGRPRKI
jgi:transcriptional regulator with XRE-family HTH domain